MYVCMFWTPHELFIIVVIVLQTARGAIDNTIGYLEGYIAHLDTAVCII